MDGGWIDDLLRADVYASGIPGAVDCRHDDVAGPALDGADGAEREPCRDRLSERTYDDVRGLNPCYLSIPGTSLILFVRGRDFDNGQMLSDLCQQTEPHQNNE